MNSLRHIFLIKTKKIISGPVYLASAGTLSSIAVFCFVLTFLRLDSLNILKRESVRYPGLMLPKVLLRID